MTFTNSRFEKEMQKPSYIEKPGRTEPPDSSHCSGCCYWRGIMCVSCYRELLKGRQSGR